MAYPTDLVLSGVGVAPYSARGLRQTLTPIAQAAALARTVNGVLADLSLDSFHKYASTITGSDQLAPVCDGVWPGKQVTVNCIAELAYVTSGGAAARPVVSGSSRVEGAITYYRPQLTMRVMSFSIERDEWGAVVSWLMQLEES